jgi:hypothetical protein
MTATVMVQFSHPALDSAAYVDMCAVSFKPTYKRRNKTNPLDGQFSGTEYIIAKGDTVGIENPVWSFTCYINTNNFSVADDLNSETPSTITSVSEEGISMAGKVTVGYLKAVWRNLQDYVNVKIKFGNPDAQKDWKNWDNSDTVIRMKIDSIDPAPDMSTEGSHFITVTIMATEVNIV